MMQGVAELYQYTVLPYLGELTEAVDLFNRLLVRAQQRGDLFQETLLRVCPFVSPYLIVDQPERAKADAFAAMQSCLDSAVSLPRHYADRCQIQVSLYQGAARDALDRATRAHNELMHSLNRSVVAIVAISRDLLTRAQLAAASLWARPSQG